MHLFKKETWHSAASSTPVQCSPAPTTPRRRRRLMLSSMSISPSSSAVLGAKLVSDSPERGARKEGLQGEQSASGLTVKQPDTWRSAKLLSASQSLSAMNGRPSAPPFGECVRCLRAALLLLDQCLSQGKVVRFNDDCS